MVSCCSRSRTLLEPPLSGPRTNSMLVVEAEPILAKSLRPKLWSESKQDRLMMSTLWKQVLAQLAKRAYLDRSKCSRDHRQCLSWFAQARCWSRNWSRSVPW